MSGFHQPQNADITSNIPDDSKKFNEVSLQEQKVIAEEFAFLDANYNENLMNCVETQCPIESGDMGAGDNRIIPTQKTTIENDGWSGL